METPVEWTFEQKADCFKNDIRERFEAENTAWRKEEELQKESVLKENPDFYKRHPHYEEITNSVLWDIYTNSTIEVTESEGARIILPVEYVATSNTIDMFDQTEVAWSVAAVIAEIVNGEARIVISIMLIDYWDDERSRKWKEERRIKDAYLFRKLRTLL